MPWAEISTAKTFIVSCNQVFTEFEQADKKSSGSSNELDMFLVNSQLIYFNKEKASLHIN
jgi:hypothetical protein